MSTESDARIGEEESVCKGGAVVTSDVFVPMGMPTTTYIKRVDNNEEKLIRSLRDEPYTPVSISGPSKSGKTVLVVKTVGENNLIKISGADVESVDDFWKKVCVQCEISRVSEVSYVDGEASGAKGACQVDLGLGGVAKTSMSVGIEESVMSSLTQKVESGKSWKELAHESLAVRKVIFVDDFHYMSQKVQKNIGRQIKVASEKGIRFCIASVPHRGDDAVRSNPELRGRLVHIDVGFWRFEDVKKIAEYGFSALNMLVSDKNCSLFALKSYGSPQLMQRICLDACWFYKIMHAYADKTAVSYEDKELSSIFQSTCSTINFKNLVLQMRIGKTKRGVGRKPHKMLSGGVMDKYSLVLRAVSQLQGNHQFTTQDVKKSVENISSSNLGMEPVRDVLRVLCEIAVEEEGEDVIEFKRNILTLVSPYFMFYLNCHDWAETDPLSLK